MSDENLTFLSIDQALADFRDFIRYINHKYDFSSSISSSTKWVAFGSFYGGTLAAWLRKKYPRLIHMAVVTNPLVAKIDYHEYYEEIQKQIASYNPKCVTQINMAFKETTNQYLTESKIIKQFMLCNNYFDKPDDYEYNSVYFFMSLRMLYEKLYNNFAMFGTDDQSLVFEKINLYNSIIRPYDGFPTPVIENFCDIMLDNSIPSVLDRLAAVFRTTMNYYNLPCIQTYKESIITPLINIHFNSVDKNAQLLGWSRPWQYQLCTEFGLFPTIHERTHFVHVGLRFYFFICADLFNIPSNDIQYILGNSTKGINKIYNELNINHDRTIYVHGSIDPWHLLEPNENRTKNTLSVYMKGANYMVNEDNTVPNMDLQDTIFAHLSIKAYISKWLAEE